VKEEDVM